MVAYRELRLLETEVLRELFPTTQLVTDIGLYTKINVDQFYGIEIGEFASRIAEVALWMMDHIMNSRLSVEFGQSYLRIPLRATPNIRHGDALETDWAALLAPELCSYVLGNPPFLGAKVQSEKQRAQIIEIAELGKSGGTLDYVCAWFLKAGAYVRASRGSAPRIGFVATNSITQGEQVAQLWPLLFDRHGLEIAFAHRTFQWLSDAKGKAHVHCVIIGLVRREDEPKEKRLFSYEDITGDAIETRHAAVTAYLTDANGLGDRHIVVKERPEPISLVPKMIIGTKPIDGGYLILTPEEIRELEKDDDIRTHIRPFVGSKEYINGTERRILFARDIAPHSLRANAFALSMLESVRLFRLGLKPPRGHGKDSKPGRSSIALAQTPAEFHVTVAPQGAFLAFPEVSSERRNYVPIGWLNHPVVPSNKLKIVVGADLWDFGILTSQMHMAWMRAVTGRLESRYMYSVDVVYNTFPWPKADDKARSGTRFNAQKVLDARAAHPGATLADLYDPDTMPPDLRKAHRALDLAVDRLYRREPFSSDRERVEHLFTLYEKLTATLFTPAQKKAQRKPRQRSAS